MDESISFTVMDTQPLFKKMDPQSVFRKIPQEVKTFWDKHMKDEESLMFEADPYTDALDPSQRFTIYKDVKSVNRTYLCRGQHLINGSVITEYLFEGAYYSEEEFLKMLKLKIFW